YRLLTETFSIGGGTLYRHKDLWHPLFLNDAPVENPPDPPAEYEDSQLDCAKGASNWHNPTSLLSLDARNDSLDKGLGDRTLDISEDSPGNAASAVDLEATQQAPEGAVAGETEVLGQTIPVMDFQDWKQTLAAAAEQAREEAQRIKEEAFQRVQVERMRRYLRSGDPILMAEAIAWSQLNPGMLGGLEGFEGGEGDRLG
ncbi:MAG: hypothetical protein MUF49_02555, partial [Oculatellaceae cyanobacterium Prado106]|nr:hypothetical protein [Oculatellaceae cyanobacterium Prado106]